MIVVNKGYAMPVCLKYLALMAPTQEFVQEMRNAKLLDESSLVEQGFIHDHLFCYSLIGAQAPRHLALPTMNKSHDDNKYDKIRRRERDNALTTNNRRRE